MRVAVQTGESNRGAVLPVAPSRVAQDGLRPTLPPGVPDPYSDLMKACWHAEPARRPSFEEALARLEEVFRAASC